MLKALALVLEFIKPLAANGQTRFLITLVAISVLGGAIYFDKANGIHYGIGIAIIAAAFITSKTITDYGQRQSDK